jgi:type IV pilus assembly protein PilW
LVIRTVSGKPIRLSANTALGTSTLNIENIAGGKCSDGTTAKVSGFCANSHGLIASCTSARIFSVNSLAGSALTISSALAGAEAYTTAGAEVFPMQTVVYYVKKSSSGTTTSLYRRTFDGDYANGLEQELIEGVENMQMRYGVDTTAPTPDGVVDTYVDANAVGDWTKVVAVRMGLLMRATDPVGADVAVAASAPVNGVTVTYPTTGSKYDRRVFTTTIAVRNTISYF